MVVCKPDRFCKEDYDKMGDAGIDNSGKSALKKTVLDGTHVKEFKISACANSEVWTMCRFKLQTNNRVEVKGQG